MARTAILQIFLDNAWDAAPIEANTLRNTLRSFETEAAKLVSTGSLSSVSKNSANQSYALPSAYNLTQVEIIEHWRALINLFDLCASDLDVSSGGDQDQAIYTEMKLRLIPSREVYSDISAARCYA